MSALANKITYSDQITILAYISITMVLTKKTDRKQTMVIRTSSYHSEHFGKSVHLFMELLPLKCLFFTFFFFYISFPLFHNEQKLG